MPLTSICVGNSAKTTVAPLAGPAGAHIHGQLIAGFLAAGIAAYISVRFLTRYFTTRTLTPFAFYCLIAGGISTVWFAAS